MSETFQDNMALCMNYCQKVNSGVTALQELFQETATAATVTGAVDMINVERGLTAFVAEKLGLTVDREIFRGAVPPGYDGCSVSINHLLLSADEAIPTVLAQFICRDADRNRVMELTSVLARQFPVHGMSVTAPDGSVVTARLIQVLSADIQSGQADNGKIKAFGLISFKVQL